MHLHNTPDGGSTVTEARQCPRHAGDIAGGAAASTCEDAMPGYARRRDTVHAEIRDVLRECGFSVFDAGGVGGSFPDLVVGAHGTTYLVELKGPRGKLSEGQREFADNWKGGPVIVARSVDDVLLAIVKQTRGIQ